MEELRTLLSKIKPAVDSAKTVSTCLVLPHYGIISIQNVVLRVTNKDKLRQYELGFRIKFPSLFTSFKKRKANKANKTTDDGTKKTKTDEDGEEVTYKMK
jgi:hypothetical protein